MLCKEDFSFSLRPKNVLLILVPMTRIRQEGLSARRTAYKILSLKKTESNKEPNSTMLFPLRKIFVLSILIFFLLYSVKSKAQPALADSLKLMKADSTTNMYTDSTVTAGQKDLIDIFLKMFKLEQKQTTRPEKKLNFSFIPVASVNSGSGSVAVSSINAAFYLGDPQTTNLSNVYLIPYTDFSSRAGIILRPMIWAANNKWNFPGEIRLADSDQKTYGLGTNSSSSVQSILEVNQFRVYATAHRLLYKSFYAGIGYNLDHYYKINELPLQEEPTDLMIYSVDTLTTNRTASGITFNLLRDNRKNAINPTGGFYTTAVFKWYAEILGSSTSFSALQFDIRKYISFNEKRHQVLALWSMYWGTYGEVPYLNLPGTALDLYGRTGRGYYYGRYRGKQMLYAEVEYRFDLSANGFWGAVVFANAQSYTEPDTRQFEYVKPAGGLGLRLKFNKRSNANLTFDVAVGKNSFNWYLNLGEFF